MVVHKSLATRQVQDRNHRTSKARGNEAERVNHYYYFFGQKQSYSFRMDEKTNVLPLASIKWDILLVNLIIKDDLPVEN